MTHSRAAAVGTAFDRSTTLAETVLSFANAASSAMISTRSDGIIEFVNAAAARLFGYAPADMIGRPIDIIIPENMRGAHNRGLSRVARGGETKLIGKTVEVTACKRDGSEFPIELSISSWSASGKLGFGAVIRDISERRQRELRLMRLAHHDSLTGLRNRHHFEALLGELFEAKRPAAVILLDLDGLKEVNDSLGHATGDALLQAVAIRLPAVLDESATVARHGGDKFGILVADCADPPAARDVVNIVTQAFASPYEVGEHLFQIGTSIGYAIAPAHGQDAEELIASADFALHQAKKAGGRRERLFEPAMRSASLARRATQDELLKALKHSELELHYQPQVTMKDGAVFGVEALLRWRHPERGLLAPASFLPAIDSSSLAIPVGNFVIEEACRQVASWRTAGLDGLRMAVNLFAAQLRSDTLVRQIKKMLARYGIEPGLLELEITENIALHSDDASLCAMRELRDLGVKIAFDDFGTGYASLQSLKRFPLTTLKIDRGFVSGLTPSRHDTAILRAMITMCRDLGLETIVEGIETQQQVTLLQDMNCRCGQGYFYGRPMPARTLLRQMLDEPISPQVLRKSR